MRYTIGTLRIRESCLVIKVDRNLANLPQTSTADRRRRGRLACRGNELLAEGEVLEDEILT